ncbi:Uncharacterized protein cmbei_7005006 [Cryptosporidium meleagridis]
MRFLAYLGL